MNYEGQICRAPMERASFMLPVMVGCSYGKCKFCNLFRHLRYREIPLDQIEEELKRVKGMHGKPSRIFLGDGNAFGLGTERLAGILERIRFYFPECGGVNMDATVLSILNKTDEELRFLYRLGVRHLYIGIESGLDDVLRFMEKDHGLDMAYEAAARIRQAGMIFDAHIMTGVAGKGRGLENAGALAGFFERTHPAHVVNFSMFLHREAPLFRNIQDHTYVPADELENLKEESRLLELLGAGTAKSNGGIVYDGFHDYIKFRVRGRLKQDAGRMLEKLYGAVRAYEGREPLYAYVQGECPKLETCDGHEKIWRMV